MSHTPDSIRDVLVALDRAQAVLGDVRDVPNTLRAHEAYHATVDSIIRFRVNIRSNADQLAKLAPPIADVELWIAYLHAWCAEWREELARLPATNRSPAQDQRMQALTAAVVNATEGVHFWPNGFAQLAGPMRDKIIATYPAHWDMATLCPWHMGHGALPEAEAKLAELTKRRDRAHGELDHYLAAARALLDPEFAMPTH